MPIELPSANQQQTEDTFSFKWRKRDTYDSPHVRAEWKRWLLEKYVDGESEAVGALLGEPRKKILDAGCGSGGSASLFFGDLLKQHDYLGVDISDAVEVARMRFAELGLPGAFLQCDLNRIPESFGLFDVIFSEGVLHHTDSVESALATLAPRLKPGGLFIFYVYARKAPIREFTDDHVRTALEPLGNDEAWAALRPLTLLGKQLGELNVQIEIQEDIPYLGIPKGTYDLQRLFYYKFCKTFYRPEYSLEEMNHINFDWFRPKNCFRHTKDEIENFCGAAGLLVRRMHIEESGFSVIAARL